LGGELLEIFNRPGQSTSRVEAAFVLAGAGLERPTYQSFRAAAGRPHDRYLPPFPLPLNKQNCRDAGKA
jgi:hypothetical protein